jgi:hypothetical protein
VLYIDGPATVVLGGAATQVEPEASPNPVVLKLLAKAVNRAWASDDGRLEIEFSDGDVLRIEPGHLEARQICGEDGLRLVSAAGGRLDEWHEDAPASLGPT